MLEFLASLGSLFGRAISELHSVSLGHSQCMPAPTFLLIEHLSYCCYVGTFVVSQASGVLVELCYIRGRGNDDYIHAREWHMLFTVE